MKKLSISFSVLALMLMLFTTSCDKEEETEVEPSEATVKGIVRAVLDVNEGLEPVSGAKLTFAIDGADLDHNPNPNYPYKEILRSVTTGSDGSYTISLPASQDEIAVEVRFADFEYDQVQFDNSTERTIYSRNNGMVSIYDGATVIQDYNY